MSKKRVGKHSILNWEQQMISTIQRINYKPWIRFIAATQSLVVILTRGRSVFVYRERCQAPHMLPTSERSLSQTTRGTFFMVCVLLPRPGGEPKTVRCGVVTTRLRTSNPFGRGTLRYCSGTEPEGRNWVFNHITIRLFVSGERPSFLVPLYRPELVGLLG